MEIKNKDDVDRVESRKLIWKSDRKEEIKKKKEGVKGVIGKWM
jgi:hypothetical protein